MRNAIFIFTLSFLAFSIFSCATSAPLSSDQITRSRVVELPEVDKDEIFVKVNTWFVKKFVSAESVIEYSDKEAGKVAGKYASEIQAGNYWGYARQTMIVDIKDGKARIEISDPSLSWRGNILTGGFNPPYNYIHINRQGVNKDKVMNDLIPEWKLLMDEFAHAMNTQEEIW